MKKFFLAFILLIGLLDAAFPQTSIFKPLPEEVKVNKEKANLGKLLFFDPILSQDRTVSCFSCHDIYNKCGTDHQPVSTGIFGRKGRANALTVYNAFLNFRQFWNGRAKNLKEQILFVFKSPSEMGMTEKELKKRMENHQFYREKFKKIYGNVPITPELVADAIAEFEKTLITPSSKFDLYLKGKVQLSEEEKIGLELFKSYGCVSCHNGINIGGNSFQKLGAVIPYPWKPTNPDRYQITKNPDDKNVYRVPSLRNVDCTYPYFHDGTVKTLYEAVKLMGKHNLGIDIPDEDIRYIIRFLKTLRGKTPKVEF